MSATLTHDLTREPYRLPSGILAVAVHGAFFALLYFGFNWQSLPPATRSVEVVMVDMWSSLPEEVVEPLVQPVVEEVEQPVAQAEAEIKPDIVLKDTKKIVTEPVAPKPAKNKVEAKKVEAKPAETKPVAVKPAEPSPDARIAEQQAAREQAEKSAQAEKTAAANRVVDEYIAKIKSKIRSNIVPPPDVAKDARAEFSVTLLPGGAVLPPRLIKSSGNAAYDNAVERAILKSDPLPLPPDAAMYNRFRELKLVFKPTE